MNGCLLFSEDWQQIRHFGEFPRLSIFNTATHPTEPLAALKFEQYPLHIVNLNTGSVRTLGADAPEFSGKCCWSPDGHLLAAATKEGDLHLWNNDLQPQFVGKIHEHRIESLTWNSDGSELFSIDSAGLIKRNNIAKLSALHQSATDPEQLVAGISEASTLFVECTGRVRSFVLSQDGKQFAISEVGNPLTIIDANTGAEVRDPVAFNEYGYRLQYSRDGRWLAGFSDWEAIAWDIADDWSVINQKIDRHPSAMACLDDSQVIIGTRSGKLIRWNIDQQTLTPIYSGIDIVQSIQVRRDQPDRVLVGAEDGAMREIQLPDGELISLTVVTHGPQLPKFTAGGFLLNGRDSLQGLSCLVEDRNGRLRTIPAPEFYELHQPLR